MRRLFEKYGSYVLLIILFMGVIVVVNNTKKSYALTTGINRQGKVIIDFTTNFNNSTVNYIGAAGASSEVKDNFIVPQSLKTNDGKTLYLFSKNLEIPGTGQTFGFDSESGNPTTISDRGLIYIISHGYNDTNKVKTVFTNSTYKTNYGELTDAVKQQYVTQIAIWLYMYKYRANFSSYCNIDNIDTLCNFNSTAGSAIALIDYSDVISIITTQANKTNYKWLNYILRLVEEAESYKNKTAETPKLTSLGNVEFTLSGDEKKVTSSLVTPTSAKNNDNFMYYTVEIVDTNNYGVYLVDKSGNKITNLSNMSGSFKVVIPIGDDVTKMDLTSVDIKIYGIYTYDEGYSYKITASTGERVKDLPKYSNVSLGYVPTNTIGVHFKARNFTKFTKIKSGSKEPLAGATLNIINKSNGSKVAEWISDEKPHTTFLEDGEYKLCETVAPEGYELSKECIDFTIKNGEKIKIIAMENSPMIVPNTGLNGSKKLFIIGSIILLIGGAILIIFKRTKKDVTI